MVAAGHGFKASTLKEFKGEAWADEAIAQRKEAGK